MPVSEYNGSKSSASTIKLINLRRKSLPADEVIDGRHDDEKFNDFLVNGHSTPKLSDKSIDATSTDRRESLQPTLRKSRLNGKDVHIRRRRLSHQPFTDLANHRSKDLTPKKQSKNGLVKIVYDFIRNHKRSISSDPSVGRIDSVEFSENITPKKVKDNKTNNGANIESSQNDVDVAFLSLKSKLQESEVSTSGNTNGVHKNINLNSKSSKESNEPIARKTRSNGTLNGSLPSFTLPQNTSQEIIQEETNEKTVTKTKSNGVIDGVVSNLKSRSNSPETPEKSTVLKPRKTKNNGMANGTLNGLSSSLSALEIQRQTSVSEEPEKIALRRSRRSSVIEKNSTILKRQPRKRLHEDNNEPTPKRARKNGTVNGIVTKDQSCNSTLVSSSIEVTADSKLKTNNGQVNSDLANIITSESNLQEPHVDNLNEVYISAENTSQAELSETVEESLKKIVVRNVVVNLERLTIDNGVIISPESVKGIRIYREQALKEKYDQLSNFKQFRKPKSGKDTYSREYVVEKILNVEYDIDTKTLMFFVKWEGYSTKHCTWEPIGHLQHCTKLVAEFLSERLAPEVLDSLCEKMDMPNRLSDQSLLDELKVSDLTNLPDKVHLQEKLMCLKAVPLKAWHVRKIKEGKKAMMMYQLLLRRENQLTKLKEWEDSINQMTKEEAQITIENTVDLDCPPEGFTYIHESIATNGIVIPSEPETWCACKECAPRKDCCGKQPHNGYTYRMGNKINVNPGNAVYECNKKCKCSEDCRNRVVQQGRKVPLCIFRTSNGCGWGVKAMRKIYCGEFVCEYVGEIITHEEAEVRGRAYDQEGRTYLFDLDYNSKDNPYTVDAAKFGNISHFINHSCDPNLGVYAVWIDCSDPNLPRLALFALREIQKDEEITFDYMMNIDPEVPTTPEKPRFLKTPDKNQVIQNGRNICKCEADACRRYLF
ncbi:unnamed protein product [Acanthoscelides obtectus]|uniref:Uncharacterized protein n=1 Tax=Acanthoscelides obtectus TaxID=200917 RepID=A0A9P0P6E7_ACAOB|nr:unnamed protein product [Acanthoscelides obtectus]CAK1629308.1 Histone-lysine N-methyltransferase Su(var)3-9 [Acanthoscelides obtectus]